MLTNEKPEAAIVRLPAIRETLPTMMPAQIVVKTLTPGEIEVGTHRDRLRRYVYSTGGMIVCRSQTEEWVRLPRPMGMLVVPIPPDSLSVAVEESGRNTGVIATPDLRDPVVSSLMTAIQLDIETGSHSGSLFRESILVALATTLLGSRSGLRKSPSRYGLTTGQLNRVEGFMLEYLEEDIHLKDLANLLGISQGHFGQMFKKSTGLSPHQRLIQLRLDAARHMLTKRRLKVLDVAVACGFRTQQHFATAFRKRYGLAPTAYQRLH